MKRLDKRMIFGVTAAVGIVVVIAVVWAASSANALDDLKRTSIFTAAPAPQSVLLAEGQGNGEGAQKPTVVKVYVVDGNDVGALVRHYEQTYPSYKYRWEADYYFPSPGVGATNLIGKIGTANVAVYIAPTPHIPSYPVVSIKSAPPGYNTFVTIVVSAK